jgi:hypothetical protein
MPTPKGVPPPEPNGKPPLEGGKPPETMAMNGFEAPLGAPADAVAA